MLHVLRARRFDDGGLIMEIGFRLRAVPVVREQFEQREREFHKVLLRKGLKRKEVLKIFLRRLQHAVEIAYVILLVHQALELQVTVALLLRAAKLLFVGAHAALSPLCQNSSFTIWAASL